MASGVNLQRELALARAAARAAGALIREVYATPFAVESKGVDGPVTEADRRANNALCLTLSGAFPDDGLCAEENDPSHSLRAARRGGRCWRQSKTWRRRAWRDRTCRTRCARRWSWRWCVMRRW